jgi:cell division protein FtsQ
MYLYNRLKKLSRVKNKALYKHVKIKKLEKKKIIRKILVLGAWLLVISGMVTLLVAANRKQEAHLCTDVVIGIKGSGEKFYIEKSDVAELIERTANGTLVNRPVASINLGRLEEALEKNLWIRNAELYFDSRDALHVHVDEREPIARVFTKAGGSFYIDSSGHRMPLLEKVSVRVPVVTGFTSARKLNAQDSVMLNQVKQVALFIYNNEFWNAQVGQIDLRDDNRFELIPVIGDHVIRLGDGNNIEDKLNRLFVFYKQVMSKAGFNRYAAVDVSFDGQVVAVNKGPVSAVDSIQLQRNIEALVNKASMESAEEGMNPDNIGTVPAKDSAQKRLQTLSANQQANAVSVKTDPNPPVQTSGLLKPEETLKTEVQVEERNTAKEKKKLQPKAIMKKKEQ